MLKRRHLLAAAAWVLFGGRADAGSGLRGDSEPAETVAADDKAFMARALELARQGAERGDGTAYGAVVVRAGVIVGEGWNRSDLHNDATAHAETEAIRDAARRLGTRDLGDCVLYTNGGRPCPMCETAAYWAGIRTLKLEGPDHTVDDAGPPIYGGC